MIMPTVTGSELIKKLPQPVITILQLAGKTAQSNGVPVYMVGGIVRDLLLERPNTDIDIMVEGDAMAFADSLAVPLKLKPVKHSRFGTATFKLDGYRIDLATCRSESYSRPGALPSVKPGDIRDDLLRRDFTINAMALCINPGRLGALTDHTGGLHDLKDRLIRILHDNSFIDDATRIMRAVRYEQRLGFKLEKKTQALLLRDLEMLDTISGDRLRRELFLWLAEERPWRIVQRAGALGVLGRLHPSLEWHPAMRMAFIKASRLKPPASLSLLLCLLTYHHDEEPLNELLLRLNLVGTRYDLACNQTLQLRHKFDELENKDLSRSDIYYLLEGYALESIQACLLCSTSPTVVKRLKLYLNVLRHVKPLLNGRDLANLGVKEGRIVGRMLKELLTARLNGRTKTRKAEKLLAARLLAGFIKPGMQP